MKKILGISAFFHDSAAALVIDGKVVAAAQEERFSRLKNDADFPVQAIKYCLEEYGLTVAQLDAVVFYDKPLLKFERILETFYAIAPQGISAFIKAMPKWMNQQLLLKKVIRRSLKKVSDFDEKKITILFSEHHLSHAASAFYVSSFEQAAVLTIDGVGEWATLTLGLGNENKIQILKQLNFPHSLGLLYSAFTYFLGFKVNSGEYKLMGLAAYGNPDGKLTKMTQSRIETELVDIKADGSFRLNPAWFTFTKGERMIDSKKWVKLFNVTKRKGDELFNQEHADVALAIQRTTEKIILRLAQHLKSITGAQHLCLAGGVALNGVANGKLLNAGLYDDIFVQPAAGDAGGAVGAALAVHYMYFNSVRQVDYKTDAMKGALLGPSFTNKEIEQALHKYDLPFDHYNDFDSLIDIVAEQITTGKVIGWFQGKMEFGPRALGNRSILADPRDKTIQSRLNLKIKNRESFRPFAPVVLEEDSELYFQKIRKSPYMNLVDQIKDTVKKEIPGAYQSWDLQTKLNFPKSEIPAVTHVDFSARIQTVNKESNPKLWKLILKFKSLTNLGMLVNTSFNQKDEPIVCSPEDAINCFVNTEMDYLVLGNHIIKKG